MSAAEEGVERALGYIDQTRYANEDSGARVTWTNAEVLAMLDEIRGYLYPTEIRSDVTPGLTPEEEIDALGRELLALDQVRIRTRRRGREIEEQIDRIRLAQRPTYPTPDQVLGLHVAAQKVKAGDTPSSHLGDPAIIGDYSVTVAGNRGAIYLNVNAPYSKARGGARLWVITEEEVTRTLDLIRAEGLTVSDHWTHDHGLSVVAWPKA